jgi:O-antigen/teichoic acid export membrane protein
MTDAPTRAPRPRRSILGTASIVSVHKAAQIAGSLLMVVVAPRLLGAEDYGRLAFLLALAYLGQILGDFGTLDVFGRFVPGMGEAEAQRLYMRTLAFKLPVSLVCGALTAGAALLLASWVEPAWAGLIGLSVALRIVAWAPFQFALGVNRVGAWMTEQAWRSWTLLAGLLLFFPVLGFSGALLALLSMEAIFCALGLMWARAYWLRAELRWDWGYFKPFVVAGLGFFLANLTAVALYRSGPVLVEALTGQTAQAGYIDLAIGLFLMAYVTVSQFAQSLIPTLSGYRAAGQMAELRRLLGSFMRIGLLVTGLGAALVWLLAGWGALLLFGPAFAPAAEAMRWISLGMPLAVLAWSGNIIATVTGRGGAKFAASLAALLVFLAAALLLIPAQAAAGAAIALSLAVLAHVVVLTWRLRPDFDLGMALAR